MLKTSFSVVSEELHRESVGLIYNRYVATEPDGVLA